MSDEVFCHYCRHNTCVCTDEDLLARMNRGRFTAQTLQSLQAKAALFDEMRQALTKVLMVSLLPNDVSGCQMVEDARQVLLRADKIAEAIK